MSRCASLWYTNSGSILLSITWTNMLFISLLVSPASPWGRDGRKAQPKDIQRDREVETFLPFPLDSLTNFPWTFIKNRIYFHKQLSAFVTLYARYKYFIEQQVLTIYLHPIFLEDLDTRRLKHNPANLICFLLYWITF